MRGTGLVLALAVAASGAGAQELRDVIVEAVRAEGCAMDEATAERVFGGLGLDRDEVGAVVQGMIARGEVSASADGARITLSPELCGSVGGVAAEGGGGGPVDLRAAALAYLQAWDCSVSGELLTLLATDVHGREAGDMQAVVEALVAEGVAEVDPTSGDVSVRAPECETSPDFMTLGATSWIEEWLYAAEGCRLPLAELAARADAVELRVDRFDVALASLVEAGVVRQEGPDLVHATACRVRPVPSEAELVESFRGSGFRGMVALRVMADGCRVPAAGREAWLDAMVAHAVGQMPWTEPPSAEAVAAVRAGLQEVLDNPGGAYEIDGASGDLVMVHCSP